MVEDFVEQMSKKENELEFEMPKFANTLLEASGIPYQLSEFYN